MALSGRIDYDLQNAKIVNIKIKYSADIVITWLSEWSRNRVTTDQNRKGFTREKLKNSKFKINFEEQITKP